MAIPNTQESTLDSVRGGVRGWTGWAKAMDPHPSRDPLGKANPPLLSVLATGRKPMHHKEEGGRVSRGTQ